MKIILTIAFMLIPLICYGQWGLGEHTLTPAHLNAQNKPYEGACLTYSSGFKWADCTEIMEGADVKYFVIKKEIVGDFALKSDIEALKKDIQGLSKPTDTISSELKNDPKDCDKSEFATAIDKKGNLTCNKISVYDMPQDYVAKRSVTSDNALKLSNDPDDCKSGEFANGIDAGGNLRCGKVTKDMIPTDLSVSFATKALSFLKNPINCPQGQVAGGVDASGDAEGCVEVAMQSDLKDRFKERTGTGNLVYADKPELHEPYLRNATGSLDGNSKTASELLSVPKKCDKGTFSVGINKNGDSICDGIKKEEIDKVNSAQVANKLSKNGDNCPQGRVPMGVDEYGNVEDCIPIQTYNDNLQLLSKPDKWSFFYSDGENKLHQLQLGETGSVLVSKGVNQAPVWKTTASQSSITKNYISLCNDRGFCAQLTLPNISHDITLMLPSETGNIGLEDKVNHLEAIIEVLSKKVGCTYKGGKLDCEN